MIDLTLVSAPIRLSFWSYFETEGGSFWDQMWVNVSTDNFVSVNVPLLQIHDGDYPQNTWTLIELNISAYAGSTIWIRFFFDTIDTSGNDFEGWLIDNVVVDDTPVPFDVVTVEAWNRAPPYVEPGMWDIMMLQLNFTSSPGSSEIESIRVDLTGVPSSSNDVPGVVIYHDVDGNDVYNPMFDMMVGGAGFPPPPGPYFTTIDIMAFPPLIVNPGTTTKLFVMYSFNMVPPATIGNWTGAAMVNETYFGVSTPDVVAPFAGIDTYVAGVGTEIVAQAAETMNVEAWDRAPTTAEISEPDVLMLQLNLSVAGPTGLVMFQDMRVNLSGVPPSSDDIQIVKLWRDVDSDDALNTQKDEMLSQMQFPPPPGPYQVTLWTMMPIVIYPGTPLKLFISYSINAQPPATPGNWTGAQIDNETFFTVVSPDTVAAFAGINTYSAGAKTQIVAPSAEQLMVQAWNRAPQHVNPGLFGVMMAQLNLSVSGPTGNVVLTNISVDLSGLPPTSDDVTFLSLYEDVNANDVYEPMIDMWLDGQSFSPPPCPCGATFSPMMPITIAAGTAKKLFLFYDIANTPQATLGNWIGAQIADETNFIVNAPDTVAPFGGIDTYSPGTTTLIDEIHTLNVFGVPKASGSIPQGSLDVVMEQLLLNASTGNVTITDIGVNQTGTGTDGDTANVYLWDDTNDNGVLNIGDTLLDTQSFVGGGLTFTGFTFTVYAGTNESLLIALDVTPGATPGNTLRITIADNSYIIVTMPDEVAGFAPIDSNFVTISAPGSDSLTVTGFDLAPANVNPGELGVEMERLTLTASSGTITVNSIQVDLSGTGVAADVANVEIWDDVDGNDVVNIGDVMLGSGAFAGGPPPTVTITLGAGYVVTSGTPETLLVVYDIAGGATPGNTVGASIVDETYVVVAAPDIVNAFGPLASTESVILGLPDALTVVGADLAPVNVQQGDPNVAMERLTLTAGTGSVTVNSIQVDLAGTGGIPDIALVEIWDDVNGNDVVDGPDALLGSGALAGGPPPTVTITLGAGFVVTSGTPETLLVVYDIAIGAIPGNTVGVSIVDETYVVVTAPDTVNAFGPLASINSLILAAVPDTLTVTSQDLAPATVNAGDPDVAMLWLTLTANTGSVNVLTIRNEISGTGGVADIAGVDIYDDVNDNQVYDPGTDILLGSGMSPLPIPLGGGFLVTSGTPENLLILYDIALGATPGNTVGVNIPDESYMTVSAPDTVNAFGSQQSTNSLIQAVVDTLTVTPIGIPQPTAYTEETNVSLTRLRLSAGSNAVTVTGIDISLFGTAMDADFAQALLYDDTDDSGTITPGDVLVDTAAVTNGRASFSGFAFPVTSGTDEDLIIAVDISPNAVIGHIFAMVIMTNLNVTVNAPDVVSPMTFPIGTPFVEIIGGTITGTVEDSGGTPIAGANVQLIDTSTSIIMDVVATNSTGGFIFKDVYFDSYTLNASATDYEHNDSAIATISLASPSANAGPIQLAEISIGPPQPTEGSVEGNVYDKDGNPITGATVELLDDQGNVVESKTTNAQGNYNFDSVAFGTYSIRITKSGLLSQTSKEFALDADNPSKELVSTMTSPPVTPEDEEVVPMWAWLLIVLFLILFVVSLLLFLMGRGRKPEATPLPPEVEPESPPPTEQPSEAMPPTPPEEAGEAPPPPEEPGAIPPPPP
jgi:hypothetical protein